MGKDFSRARGENPLEFIRIDGYPGSVFPSKQTKQAKAGMMNKGRAGIRWIRWIRWIRRVHTCGHIPYWINGSGFLFIRAVRFYWSRLCNSLLDTACGCETTLCLAPWRRLLGSKMACNKPCGNACAPLYSKSLLRSVVRVVVLYCTAQAQAQA